MKVDPYNFELYRFKVGAFFETQRSCLLYVSSSQKHHKMHTHVEWVSWGNCLDLIYGRRPAGRLAGLVLLGI